MGDLSPQMEAINFHDGLNDFSVGSIKVAFACVINSEIGAVLAVMRRNVRWGVQYVTDVDHLEHSLIHSLKELRKKIFSWHYDWQKVDPSLYLQPFLDVIRSDETGAPITGVALSSIYKILALDMFDIDTTNVGEAMHKIVDSVTTCRFEVTDAASEEVVLMKILQVLLACMKSKASFKLSNQHVCNMVNTCFRVVHQASSKGELLQRIARHTMHDLIRCIFSRLPYIELNKNFRTIECTQKKKKTEDDAPSENGQSINHQIEKSTEEVSQPTYIDTQITFKPNDGKGSKQSKLDRSGDKSIMNEPFGVPCMVEIFQFLCSLLDMVEHVHAGSRSNPTAYDEDVPLFALGLINSAIELGGASFGKHPALLSLVQGEFFRNMMQSALSSSPLILSTVCSSALNLYHHLRSELKVQFESFFSCVLLWIAQGKNGTSYQQQEVAVEALVDFCRQPGFVAEMFANFDCDITCNNLFEDLVNLLSKTAFPVNGPLTALHTVALDGLLSMIHGISERAENEQSILQDASSDSDYKDFWTLKCQCYTEPQFWVPHVRKLWHIKRMLMIGSDQFNRDPKKGLHAFQEMQLLSDQRNPKSVACVFRYTFGLDKNVVGDFLGNHDEFCIKVLHEFSRTFDFHGMTLDTALRFFLGTFRLPGESQKIQRILEAFSESYYEQVPETLANKDAALLLSYSLILLNTDQHNAQVKKKMTEEDFIRNNRLINDGKDLPREYLSELYQSICDNEIQMIPDQGSGCSLMTSGRWINVMHKANIAAPFILCKSESMLDCDILPIIMGPTIAAISVVFDQAEQEEVLRACIDGFSSIAKISACYHFGKTLNDMVVSLSRFTAIPNLSVDEAILAFAEDIKARIATVAVFTFATKYGDYLHAGWKNILDCVLTFQKLGLLPAQLAGDAIDDTIPDSERAKTATISLLPSSTPTVNTSRKSSGLMGRFSQLLSFDAEEPSSLPTEEELLAHQCARETIESCHVLSIFSESKFLHAESLLQLVRSIILAANRLAKTSGSIEEEGSAVFCLELLILVTLNNRDRIMLIWNDVYEHISHIVQSTSMPCTLVEKAVFGLLRICQRLLPYKENLTDELLKSLQLILKLDARVADAYCEPITYEVMSLVKSNASHIRSPVGWRSIISLLSITARHPEASEAGFDTLKFIMYDGAYLLPSNFVLCVDAARQFAESRLGDTARSVGALDLMSGSVICLTRWSSEAYNSVVPETIIKVRQDIEEMWYRLVQGLRKVCLDPREEVRNHSILMLQRSIAGIEVIRLSNNLWVQFFDVVTFTLLDELLEATSDSSSKNFRKMEESLVLATKLMTKSFLQILQDISQQVSFCKLWLGVLNRMDRCMKLKHRGMRSEKLHELIPELLKNILLVMKTTGILVPTDDVGDDSLWRLTWLHVKNICPSLQSEVYPDSEVEQLVARKGQETLPSTGDS